MQHAQHTPFSQAQADQLHPGQQQAQVHSVAEPFTVASRRIIYLWAKSRSNFLQQSAVGQLRYLVEQLMVFHHFEIQMACSSSLGDEIKN